MNEEPRVLELQFVKVRGVVCNDLRLVDSVGSYHTIITLDESTGLSGLLMHKIRQIYGDVPMYGEAHMSELADRKTSLDYTMHVSVDDTVNITDAGVKRVYDRIEGKLVKVRLPNACNISEIMRFDPIMRTVVDVVFPCVTVTETWIGDTSIAHVLYAHPWCERMLDFQVYDWAHNVH